jgi:hypothetical protein
LVSQWFLNHSVTLALVSSFRTGDGLFFPTAQIASAFDALAGLQILDTRCQLRGADARDKLRVSLF